MSPYFNDITLGTSYVVLVAVDTDATPDKCLFFTGRVFVKAASGAVTLKGEHFTSEGTILAGASFDVKNLNLCQVSAKVSVSGVLQLYGTAYLG